MSSHILNYSPTIWPDSEYLGSGIFQLSALATTFTNRLYLQLTFEPHEGAWMFVLFVYYSLHWIIIIIYMCVCG